MVDMTDRFASLVPSPVTVRPEAGRFEISAGTPVAATRKAAQAADDVRRVLAALPWPDDDGAAPGEKGPGPGQSAPGSGEVTVDLDAGLAAEGYRLRIGPGQIRIGAGGAAGAFYAAQTIRQLLPDAAWRAAPVPGPAWSLPCGEIADAPALSWRGAHLDVARHFFPKREVLALIDALAAVKLNRFHLHLTDDQGWRIESRLHPELHQVGSHRPRSRTSLGGEQPAVYDETPHGGYYTLADLAEISAYAARRMVTVVPEIEVPGHASALLAAMPGLASAPGAPARVATDWGIFSQLMSPLPGTAAFLEEIFGELISATSARYLHIGGDECVLDSWRENPQIDAYRRQLGLASAGELHAWFLRQVADMLADTFGARCVVWDEGFASAANGPGPGAGGTGPASGRGLRPDTIVMAWRGMTIARRAAEEGHDVIAAPVVPTYFDYYQDDDDREPAAIGGPVRPQDVAAFQPAGQDWPEHAARRVIGTQFQVWTEYIADGRALEYMIFPRACALAEVAWRGGSAEWEPLRARLRAHQRRLDAAGIEYRPLDGPHPWQQGGSGPRRHRAGYRVEEVAAHLDGIAAAPSG